MSTRHFKLFLLRKYTKYLMWLSKLFQVFLENDFTLKSPCDRNTESCVMFLSFKKITSFLVRSPFSELIISSCMRQSEPQGGSLFTKRSVCD